MGLFDFITNAVNPAAVVTETVMGVANGVSDIVDRFVTNPEEKAQIEKAIRDYELELQKIAMEKDLQLFTDRQSARKMGEGDRWTPRILTILFTISFFGIVSFMLSKILGGNLGELSDFALIFISTIFGAVNTIMVQIVSYYFGASKGGDEQGQKIAESIKTSKDV